MSKIKNGGSDQYGAEPFKQQQVGPAGTEGIKNKTQLIRILLHSTRDDGFGCAGEN